MTHEESVEIVKNQFKNVGKSVLINALSVYVPPFKVPPLSWIVEHYAEKIMSALADSGELKVFIVRINFNVDSQGREFMEVAIKNHYTQITGTDDEKKQSEQNLKDSFRKLIKFTN